jgi:ElaB/YqjD/DUF883 family membrane-anchored ribosome-binding protein
MKMSLESDCEAARLEIELLTKELQNLKDTNKRLLRKKDEEIAEHRTKMYNALKDSEATLLEYKTASEKWHEEYLNASKDAMDFAGKIITLEERVMEAEAKQKIDEAQCDTMTQWASEALEDAWQRVSYGKVDFTDKDFKNSMMFDHPRYSWLELQDLIKGVKQ